jgi:hypothetical protein
MAAIAAAGLIAAAAFAVSRGDNDDPRPGARHAASESTLDLTLMNGAFWAAVPAETVAAHESTLDLTLMNGAFWAASLSGTVAGYLDVAPVRLAMHEGAVGGCLDGYAEACTFSHEWIVQ